MELNIASYDPDGPYEYNPEQWILDNPTATALDFRKYLINSLYISDDGSIVRVWNSATSKWDIMEGELTFMGSPLESMTIDNVYCESILFGVILDMTASRVYTMNRWRERGVIPPIVLEPIEDE